MTREEAALELFKFLYKEASEYVKPGPDSLRKLAEKASELISIMMPVASISSERKGMDDPEYAKMKEILDSHEKSVK
jgi:hypothetical protein